MFAAVATGPAPALATPASSPEARFEAIRAAAATASLSKEGSSSLFSSKVTKLTPVTDKESFLFTAPSLCSAVPSSGSANRYLSIRLWEPTNGEKAEDIVKAFEKKFAATEKKTDGFKIYYGTVVKDLDADEFALFANIFETAEEAELINKKAVEFAAGELAGKAKLVDKVTGMTPKPAAAYVC